MPCEVIGNSIICSRTDAQGRSSLGVCRECRRVPATVLCDGPVQEGGVKQRGSGVRLCSKPLCAVCATHVPPNADYCRDHADPESRRLAL